MPKRFYNCHTHCFTYDHVPEYFLVRFLPVSKLLHWKPLRNWIRKVMETRKLGWLGWLIKSFLAVFFRFNRQKLIRFMNFVVYGDKHTQEEVIESMQQYYPGNTGYILLTMDMEYMGAGVPEKPFEQQLAELRDIKLSPKWSEKIYPFIFCDPRRLQPTHPREKAVQTSFTGKVFLQQLKDYLQQGVYHGIKLYPALGYYPFDQRMKPVYDFAVENNIPFMTHCTIGAVRFKYKLDEGEYNHPVKGINLPRLKKGAFQQFFTHPLNYECLLNRTLLQRHWGNDAPDYTNLKICIGHWGTAEEWKKFMRDAWADIPNRMTGEWPSLNPDNWYVNPREQHNNFSWFSIICDLMRKYPNVYADISYTLNDPELLPLLKMILEADDKIRQRVLFGTDFYLVSKAISEREFAINIRAALGNELFNQVAITNAERYLDNKFHPMPILM